MIAIGDHRDLDILVARGLYRRGELAVLLAARPHRDRRRGSTSAARGLQMMRGLISVLSSNDMSPQR